MRIFVTVQPFLFMEIISFPIIIYCAVEKLQSTLMNGFPFRDVSFFFSTPKNCF